RNLMSNIDLALVERALAVLADGRAVTMGPDWFQVCGTACIALNRLKKELLENPEAL
ncbi:unnamed protein product, partial [marine sediment metagenome]